jgi:hypothetical protein
MILVIFEPFSTLSRAVPPVDDQLVHPDPDPPGRTPPRPPVIASIAAAGPHLVHRPGDKPWFTAAYFHELAEVAGDAAGAGPAVTRVGVVEGPLWMVRGAGGTVSTVPASYHTCVGHESS